MLAELRANPQTACPSGVMVRLTNYLMSHTVNIATQDGFHWFCE